MLKAIKAFFDKNINVEDEQDKAHPVRLATAALMIEMMLNDGKTLESEETTLKQRLKNTFELSGSETDDLFKLAHDEAKDAVGFHQFTTLIAKEFSQPQKIQVIENLWAVAYADNELDQYEELMVRRIADLIYVSHADFINAKLRVVKEI